MRLVGGVSNVVNLRPPINYSECVEPSAYAIHSMNTDVHLRKGWKSSRGEDGTALWAWSFEYVIYRLGGQGD